MNKSTRLTVDDIQDVLYVKRMDATVKKSEEAPNDGYLILNFSADGNVVGLQVISAHEMPSDQWILHPDRALVPEDILEVADRWFAEESGKSAN